MVWSLSQTNFQRNIAVVIGINNYQNGIHSLKTAVNDASAIADLLQKEYKYQEVIRLFPHDDHGEATREKLKELLFDKLPNEIKPTESDRLLFYFAGHGIARNSEDGPAGALIPQDATLGKWETYLPMQDLNTALSKLNCHHLLVVLDCCFAGNFRWSSSRNVISALETIHREHYDRFIRYPAWQAITSAAYNQEALDYTDERGIASDSLHSPFAKALINGLKDMKADLTGDGVITAPELYLYLRDNLIDKDGLSELQTAGLWPLQKHDRGEFIFTLPGFVPEKLKPAPPLDASKNPYRGLESFDEKHNELFFGRTEQVKKLQDFVKTHALTVVLGASGSGKSSLVKAGLIPQLRQDQTEKWLIIPPIRPGETPLQALNNALKEAQFSEIQPQQPEKNLAWSIEVWTKNNPNSKLLLFIDQSEEIITLCSNEDVRKEFFQQILTAIDAHRDKLRVVLSLRSDFEPQVRDTGLKFIPKGYSVKNTELKNRWQSGRFIVSPMTRGELREAIQKPAEARVMFFQPPELVEQLIDEVVDMPGALPLVSFALSELYLKYLNRQWEAQNQGLIIERTLTQEDYQDLGGVTLSLTQKADEEYEALVKENATYAQIICHVMLRMIALGGDELTRRRVLLSELEYPAEKKNLAKAVIERFTKARLLVQGQNAEGNLYVEPAHDVLVRGWQKLLGWKQQEQESLLLQRRLTPAAIEWDSLRNKEKEQPKGIIDQTAPILDWVDRRLLTVENLVNKISAQFAKLLRQAQNQQGQSREKPVQFLWNANPYLDVLDKELKSNDHWLNQVEAEFVQESVLQKRQNISWRWRIAIAVMLGLSGLTIWALINLRQSTINQMLTNTESADGNLRSNQLILDALVDSLSAGKSLKTNLLLKVTPPKEDEQIQVIRTLRKAVYTVREYNRQEGFPSGVQSIFWAKEGRLLVVSTENDGTVRVWDKQAKKLAELPGNQYTVTQVIFSPNGSQLAIGTNKGAILFWDWENQSQATVLQQNKCENGNDISSSDSCGITSLSFNQNGRQLVSVGGNGIARLWDLSNNQSQEFQVPQNKQVPHNKIVTAGFQPNGKLLLVATTLDGKTVSVFNSSFRELSKTEQFPVSVDKVILSPNGKDIGIIYGQARSTMGSESYLWDWRQPNDAQEWRTKLLGRNEDISFSPDGKKLAATGFNDGTIRLQDFDSTIISELKGHQGQIANFNFRSDGKVLATASADGTLRLWALEEQQLGQSQELPDKLNSISFSPDGKLIATQAIDGTVRLLDLSGQLVQQFNNRYPVFNSLRFSADSKQLATLSNEGTVGILDLSSQQHKEFDGKYDPDSNLSFSPNGKQLAVTGNDNNKTVYLLDVSSGKPNDKSFPYEETIRINNVIWKSDDQILLAGVQEKSRAYKSIVLLDVKLGKQLQTITENLGADEFSGISSNKDGSLAAFVQEDGTVSLWYLDGTKMGEFKDPDRKIKSVILSPDSSMLATIGEDGTTKLWEIGKLDELLAKGCDRVRDYLQNNPNVNESDRHLCKDVISEPEKQGEISRGEKILVPTLTNFEKQAGIEAITSGDFVTAAKRLNASLKKNPNDPEALIYLNPTFRRYLSQLNCQLNWNK